MQVINTYEESKGKVDQEWLWGFHKYYIKYNEDKGIDHILRGCSQTFGKNSYGQNTLLKTNESISEITAFAKIQTRYMSSSDLGLDLSLPRRLRVGVERSSCFKTYPEALKELYSEWLKLNPILISYDAFTNEVLEVWKTLTKNYSYVMIKCSHYQHSDENFDDYNKIYKDVSLEQVLEDTSGKYPEDLRIALISNNLIGYDNYSISMSSEELDIIPLNYTKYEQRYYPLPNSEIERVTNISKLLNSWSGTELLSD